MVKITSSNIFNKVLDKPSVQTGNAKELEPVYISPESSIQEMESYIDYREALVDAHQEELNNIVTDNGTNTSEAYAAIQDSKENLDEILRDKGLFGFFGKRYQAKMNKISKYEQKITENKVRINEINDELMRIENNILMNNGEISALKNVKGLNAGKTFESENQNKKLQEYGAEVDEKISSAEASIKSDEACRVELLKEKENLEKQISQYQAKIDKIGETKDVYGKLVRFFYDSEADEALDNYLITEEEYEKIKEEQFGVEAEEIAELQGIIRYANNNLRFKKIDEYQDEYEVKSFNFDFETNLTEEQQVEMDKFVENFNKNSEKYKEVEEVTGVPAELIAAIHWRESSGDFNTYLHNGQKLGSTTTVAPMGIYFEDWTEAAIHAMKSHKPQIIEVGNIETWFEYAEAYNGYGYRNIGVSSPYVWSGSDKYTCGKFIADGTYDDNYKDKQIGVAVLIKELMS